MAKITGRRDDPGGRNEHYDVGNRKNVARPVVVKEVERGKHPGNTFMRSTVKSLSEIILILRPAIM